MISLRPALHDVVGRLLAVREFLALPEAPALAAANKRVGNILKKSDAAAPTVDPALLGEPAEQALAAALADVGARADRAYARASTLARCDSSPASSRRSMPSSTTSWSTSTPRAARQPPRPAGRACARR